MDITGKKIYQCPQCDKSFINKSVYAKHLNRKISCNNDTKLKQQREKRTCEYCNKVFTRLESLKNHLMICNLKISNNDSKVDDNTSTEVHKSSQLTELDVKKIMERLDMVSEDNKQKNIKIEMMEKELMKLKSLHNSGRKTIMNNSGNNSGNNNSNNNINNIQQNIHNEFKNEIKIVAFGKEDLSFITDDNYRLLLNKGFKSVQNLVEYIHMNQNKPENQNIYISNMRDNYILIYDGNQWQLKERDDVLQEMIENKTDILSEKFDELIKTLDESTIKKFKRFLDEKDEDRVVDQIKKELKLMLYNKKFIKEVPARISCNNTNKEASETTIVYEHPKPVVKDETDNKPKEEIVISTYRKRVSAKK